MSDIIMQSWINTDNRRYYRAHLQPDLFGDWTLVRSWGSLDDGRGQVMISTFNDPAVGKHILADISRRRLAHGYLLLAERPA